MKTVGILIYDNVETLDFTGPFEVFFVAQSERDGTPLFRVILIAESGPKVPISSIGGMRVLPHASFSQDCPEQLDVLVVPGGNGSRAAMKREATLQFVQRQAANVSLLTSVCTGSRILASAGLLKGRTVTTHWTALDELQKLCPECTVDRTKHWIKDGNLYTSAGIAAGIDMSLKIVEEMCGENVARATAKEMEYPFPETDERRIDL